MTLQEKVDLLTCAVEMAVAHHFKINECNIRTLVKKKSYISMCENLEVYEVSFYLVLKMQLLWECRISIPMDSNIV